MSGEVSDARARSLQREADRVKAREERKLEAERRRAARKNSGDDDANPLDAMANAGWDRKEYNARQKAKAGAGGGAGAGVSVGPDGQMLSKEDQTIAYASQLQSENQATLKNTIKVARETTVVGAQTIHKLNDQTEQFQRMDNALVETGDTLSRSERILRGMKSWGGAITNMFTSSKPKQTPTSSGPALAGTPTDLESKDRERNARRAIEADKAKGIRYPDEEDEEPGPASKASGKSRKDSADSEVGTLRADVVAPNAKQQAAINTFAAGKKAEDEALDELSDVLGTLKQQSQVMQGQLVTHAQMLDGIDKKVDDTSERLRQGTRTMKKIT